MLKTNKEKLVMQSVLGKVHHPFGGDFRIDANGKPMLIPAVGGICYNVNVGDSAFGWAGDHIEPGVSIRNEDVKCNNALMAFACAGNIAKVTSGDGKGAVGFVLGGHGGIEHTIVQFDPETNENLTIEDSIQIKAYGQGLELLDYPDISVMNIDPDVLERIEIEENEGKLTFPIVCEVPPYLMGSGVGSKHAYSGDYDIMTSDMEAVKAYGIDKLKFGDFVLLKDCDNSYGRAYLKGSVSIGIVIHSDCIKMGHGPGIMIIMTSKGALIEGKLCEDANILKYVR